MATFEVIVSNGAGLNEEMESTFFRLEFWYVLIKDFDEDVSYSSGGFPTIDEAIALAKMISQNPAEAVALIKSQAIPEEQIQ